jgi:hypothetical protein
MDLEQHWRGAPYTARIHRFCAYEGMDTAAGEGVGRLLRAHTRVVNYYSATYGCDTDTPPQKIMADHIGIVKPASRSADAYTFFSTVYHRNPVLDVVDSVDVELVDREKIRDVTAPTVTKIDPNGIAHVSYSFHGDGRGLGVFGCPTGHASVLVHFHIRGQVPEIE